MGKVWNFLWKSNNPLSWILDIVLIFLVVKFILFPVAGAIFATNMPFVIVESGSMTHGMLKDVHGMWTICDNVSSSKVSVENFEKYWSFCGKWYEEKNISKEEFSQYWSFLNGFNKGDIVVVKGSKDYKKGQVIIFRVPGQSTPIIHRIVSVRQNGNVFSTKGDHNPGQLAQEMEIDKSQIIGKAISRIPSLGWVKLIFVGKF